MRWSRLSKAGKLLWSFITVTPPTLLAAFVDQFYFSPPIIDTTNAPGDSAWDIPFVVNNESWLFHMYNVRVDCRAKTFKYSGDGAGILWFQGWPGLNLSFGTVGARFHSSVGAV
jgi:hypothetical protein